MSTLTDPSLWCDPAGLRIWRSPRSSFHADEALDAAEVYDDDTLAGIAAAGFNAIWLRGKLRGMMDSSVFPTLNAPDAERRRQSLQTVIARGRRHGVAVYLYFNEPLGIRQDDPFWADHPDLRGQPHHDFGEPHPVFALCTSTPDVQHFMRDAIGSVYRELLGLGGVILITASEYFTHCWSHHARFALNDGCHDAVSPPVTCPRCRDREPAEIVGELVTAWCDAALEVSPEHRPRVIAWNWSWSQWYEDPQQPVFDALPDGIEIMLDFERGTQVVRLGQTLPVDEYSLSVVGPSERFTTSKQAADARSFPTLAKMQLGTTHEIATVPNLPLIRQIHGKLRGLTQHNAAGIMGSWNFGTSFSLNTAAVRQYVKQPRESEGAESFMAALGRDYLGVDDAPNLIAAWTAFGQAFDHYPFSMQFLYFAPLNEAPAYPLLPRYDDIPMGGSWYEHQYGDRLDPTLTPGFTAQTTGEAFTDFAEAWDAGVTRLEQAFADADSQNHSAEQDGEAQHRHRREESSVARMIGLQMRSTAQVYLFHAWRQQRIEALGLTTPCEVPWDDAGRAIAHAELALAERARDLCAADPRLGLHQECKAYFYNVELIERKLQQMHAAM